MDKKEKEKELQKMVSLTFDENPVVRKQAAMRLAETDEPAAMFALIELSYDKDETVKTLARDILSKKQPGDKDAISFAEIFGGPEKEKVESATPSAADDLKKKKLLSPIEQIFDRKLGKIKSGLVKDRMMSTIEKIYLKAVDTNPQDLQKREKSMQKMLTSYADVLSGLDRIMFDERKEREENIAEVQTIQEPQAAVAKEDDGGVGLEEIGNRTDTSKIEKDLSALANDDSAGDAGEMRGVPAEPETAGEKSIFRKAYDVMMASEGDEEVMFEQSQKLVKQLQDEVNFAFKMAKQRFKAENITHLTELKNGMRNVNTDTLIVKSVDLGEYPKTKTKKEGYTRITANDDEGSEGIIYLFEGRGNEVRPGMRIKVAKGQVKTFVFSGETAMTVSKKGAVYIVL